MQSKEVAQQQAALEKQESALSELREAGERLRKQLEEKDAFIRQLNGRLEEKEGHIGLLNQRLDGIEALLGRLDQRWTGPGPAHRSGDGAEGGSSAILARLDALEERGSEAAPLSAELSARLDRFLTAAEALLAEQGKNAPAAAPEGEGHPAPPALARSAPEGLDAESASPKDGEHAARTPRYSLSKESLAALLHSAAPRRPGQDGKRP